MKSKFKLRIILMSLVLINILNSCDNVYHLYSKDKTQCISLINENDFEYIIDGDYNDTSGHDYMKIDNRKVDKIIHGVTGRWKDGKYKWSLHLRDEEIITENKIDTSKVKIYHGDDEYKKFHGPNEFHLYFEYRDIVIKYGDLIVE